MKNNNKNKIIQNASKIVNFNNENMLIIFTFKTYTNGHTAESLKAHIERKC